MSHVELFLFGTPHCRRNGEPVEIAVRKALALLIYLSTTQQPQSRDVLATMFWPESSQSDARANLRRTLYRLNQALGDDVLSGKTETIGVSRDTNLWVDSEVFRRHVTACLSDGVLRTGLSSECLERLTDAVALYTEDFLAGFKLPDSSEFDDWQRFHREELRRAFARVLDQLAEVSQSRGAHESALTYARRRLTLDPLHEPTHRRLMQLYAASGQQAAAVRQYRECVRLLDEEFDVSPQRETTELYEAITQERGTAPVTASSGRPRTHYVQSGDVHVAYQVVGDGPIDLLFVGGFVSHLELIWEEPELATFFEELGRMSRLILFDKRGVGLSGRVGYPPSLEHTLDDIGAVMDAAGSDRAVLFGVSEGGPTGALFAATYPDRVAGLILYGTMAKGTRSPDYPWALTQEQYDTWLAQMMERWGQPLHLEQFAPSRASDPQLRRWWAKVLRTASSPGAVKTVLEVLRDLDVRHILPTIRVPTLVVHRTDDRVVPIGAGRYIAQQIPDARHIELSGQDHWWWIGDSDALLSEVERFLTNLTPHRHPDRTLTTVLMTEAVGCEGSAVDTFYSTVRNEITQFGGREIASDDACVVATFDGPSRAIRCAATIEAAAEVHDVPFRAGIHTGECEVIYGTIGGVAVEIAAGVMAMATVGEVLLSRTVKDLVAGADFTFEDRGTYPLSETADPWRLYALTRA